MRSYSNPLRRRIRHSLRRRNWNRHSWKLHCRRCCILSCYNRYYCCSSPMYCWRRRSTCHQAGAAHTSGFGCFYKSLAILGVMVLVCCGGPVGWLLMERSRHQQRLADVITQIRFAGEPFDGSELNATYAIPAGAQDRTNIYLKALAYCRDRGPLTSDPEFNRILDANQNTPPPTPGTAWAELAPIEELLRRHSPAVDALHAAAKERGSVRFPLDFTEGFNVLLPHVQEVRTASRLLELQELSRLHRGEHDAAAQTLLHQLRVGETLRDEPILVSQLVRLAVFSLTLQRMEELLEQGQPSEEQLAALQQELISIDLGRSLTIALQGERAICFETCNDDGQNLKSMGGPNELGWLPEGQSLAGLRPGDTAMLLTLYTELIEASKHPFPEAADEAAASSTRLTQFFAEDQQRLPWDRHVLAKTLLPAMGTGFTTTQQRIAKQREMIARLAVERFRSRNGRLPESLNELAPDFLESIPLDSFNGQPLRILIENDDYIISSLGDAAKGKAE